MEFMVVGTTPFYGRGLRVNPGARPNVGTMALRVYPGPAPRLVIETARWILNLPPHAERIDARRVEVRTLDGTPIPVQRDGDLVAARAAWRFEIRPAAVRLIGRWA
jgi:hypothetical protein